MNQRIYLNNDWFFAEDWDNPEFRKDGFYNRHQSYPYVGCAMPDEITETLKSREGRE